MSSPTTNGSASEGQSKTLSRVERRRQWWSKNKEFKKKLRDRTTLSKKENEQQAQTGTIKVDTSRGFRSTMVARLASASIKSKKPHTDNKRLLQQKTKPSKLSNSKHLPKTDKTVKKKPKVVPKPKVEKAEEGMTPEMISEISMNAHGVDLSSGMNHVPQKYILIVSNLPLAVNKGQLMSHFRKTGGVKSIRIVKHKSGEPKGCAVIEFKDRISHGIALRLNNTTLGGNIISVDIYTNQAQLKQKNQQES